MGGMLPGDDLLIDAERVHLKRGLNVLHEKFGWYVSWRDVAEQVWPELITMVDSNPEIWEPSDEQAYALLLRYLLVQAEEVLPPDQRLVGSASSP